MEISPCTPVTFRPTFSTALSNSACRRPVTKIMEEIEDHIKDHFAEHQFKVELIQIMQDELGDLSGANKPIATLCHGPWVLASAGLLQGRTLTSWPGIRDDLVNAGATWLDEEVVRDDNLLTSRGPQDMVPFVRAITELFSERAPAPQEAPRQASSAPQRDEPPALVLSVMKWMPRPSFRTAFICGALALGLAAGNRHRPAA